MIQIADTNEKILKCKAALLDLRPHINPDEYLSILKNMVADGFILVFIEEDNQAVSVAGFRMEYKLHRGNSIYIDDVNTLPDYRKNGYAGQIMDWIIDYAKNNNIGQIHLDSGVHRYDAHRFYLKKGYNITSHHFVLGM